MSEREKAKTCPICGRDCDLTNPHCERGEEFARTGKLPEDRGEEHDHGHGHDGDHEHRHGHEHWHDHEHDHEHEHFHHHGHGHGHHERRE